MNLSRKDFLRKGIPSLLGTLLNPSGSMGAARVEQYHLRPPGFAEEKRADCHGCQECVNACAAGVLVKMEGDEGPVFDPARGKCTFCGLCLESCPNGVLVLSGEGEMPRIGIAEADNGVCLARRGGCFTCLERCPEGAICIEPGAGIRIDGGRCTGCGSCEYICPLEPGGIRVVNSF